MIKNEIDEFRKTFFEKVIEEEKQKEQIQKRTEKNCFHHYNVIEQTYPNGHEERSCSKCGHTIIKHPRILKNVNSCIIS
jgi:hypothetical protein